MGDILSARHPKVVTILGQDGDELEQISSSKKIDILRDIAEKHGYAQFRAETQDGDEIRKGDLKKTFKDMGIMTITMKKIVAAVGSF